MSITTHQKNKKTSINYNMEHKKLCFPNALAKGSHFFQSFQGDFPVPWCSRLVFVGAVAFVFVVLWSGSCTATKWLLFSLWTKHTSTTVPKQLPVGAPQLGHQWLYITSRIHHVSVLVLLFEWSWIAPDQPETRSFWEDSTQQAPCPARHFGRSREDVFHTYPQSNTVHRCKWKMWNSIITLLSSYHKNWVGCSIACYSTCPGISQHHPLWVTLAALASPLCQDNCKASALRLCGWAQPRSKDWSGQSYCIYPQNDPHMSCEEGSKDIFPAIAPVSIRWVSYW